METYQIVAIIVVIIVVIFIFIAWYFTSDKNKKYDSEGLCFIEGLLGIKIEDAINSDDYCSADVNNDVEKDLKNVKRDSIYPNSSPFGKRTETEDKGQHKEPIVLKPENEIAGTITNSFLFSSNNNTTNTNNSTTNSSLFPIINNNSTNNSTNSILRNKNDIRFPEGSVVITPATAEEIDEDTNKNTKFNANNNNFTSTSTSNNNNNNSTINSKNFTNSTPEKKSDQIKTNTDSSNTNRAVLTYDFYKKYKDTFQLIVPKQRQYTLQEINYPIQGIRMNTGKNKGEEMSRKVFQHIFGLQFPTVRPDILENPETGSNLEFDGYNPILKIAFEYNGIQHYEFPNPFHRTYEEFKEQIRRDMYKREVADRLGIYLMVIPYTVPLKHEEIYKFIVFWLPENVAYRKSIGIA